MNFKPNTPFWLSTIAIGIILICPPLIQDGMFMDGQQYACVAKNLSDGLGTFWFPFLSETWMKAGSSFFMEHPPVVYAIQSVFFTLFGDSLYVERFYSFLTALLTAYLISLIWRLLFKTKEDQKRVSWFPVLLWVLTPVVYWTYQNNLQENTMGVFTLLSVYFVLKSLLGKTNSIRWIILAGIALFLASFSKGVPGFFPVVSVAVYWLVYRNISFSKTILFSFLLLAVPILIYSVLLLNDTAYESLSYYFNERLLHRIENEGVVDNRLYSASKLFLELIPSIILLGLILLLGKVKSIAFSLLKEDKKKFWFFILIGLSASLPLMLTPVQRGFYLVPAIPYFSIALALIGAPILTYLINRISIKSKGFKAFASLSIVLLIFSIGLSSMQFGKIGRDQDMLHDVYLIGENVDYGSSFKIEDATYDIWSLQFYFIRYFGISMGGSVENSPYFLIEKGTKLKLPNSYVLVPLETKQFDLYKMKN